MARLHHATAKRAEDHGVTMARNDDDTAWAASKADAIWHDEDPKIALDAAIFHGILSAEYPALTLQQLDGWQVVGTDEEGEAKRVYHDATPPKPTDLADILEAADAMGIDPTEGYEEDDEREGGSVVAPHYKRQYAEDGHPNNNGDWLNGIFADLKLVIAEGKKTRTDVQGFNTLFAENGIISEDHKFGGAFHGTAPRTNGWEGRFRMSGGNMLRRIISDAGVLIAFGEKIEVPEAFAAKHRTKVKAKKAKVEADTTETGA